MANEQRIYEVEIHGIPHTFSLTSEQAEERGLTDKDLAKAKKSPAPANKQAPAPTNKGS